MYGGSGISPCAASTLERIAVADERHLMRVAGLGPRPDLDHARRRRRAMQQLAGAELARRADQRLPRAPLGVERLEQQHLGRAAGAHVAGAAGRGSPSSR